METWKDAVGFEGYYQVSNKGRVRSFDRLCNAKNGGKRLVKGRILKPKVTKGTGYLAVNLMVNGRATMTAVHVLVAATFIGPRPKGHDVRHRNGNKLDCSEKNLRYATRRRNHDDKLIHGTQCFGSGTAYRLKPYQVREIRQSNSAITELAEKFKCDRHTVWTVRRLKSWNPERYVATLERQISEFRFKERGVKLSNMSKLVAELMVIDPNDVTCSEALSLFGRFLAIGQKPYKLRGLTSKLQVR